MVSTQNDPMWFRAADRFGVASAILAFACALVWYGGGWFGNNILLPAVNKNLAIMDSVVETNREIASTQRIMARVQAQMLSLQEKTHTDITIIKGDHTKMLATLDKLERKLCPQ